MQTFQVLMVGPTRVGKTSTLASMSKSLQTEVHKLQYHTTIPDYLVQIATQFENAATQNDIVVKQLPLKDGSGDKTGYPIDLIPQDSDEKDITVEFIDVPGGWFTPPTQEKSNAHYGEIKNILKNSVASLWCIDCVSMIDGKNDPEYDYHKKRNEPELIKELYKNTVGLPKQHRIIFVLMRAETYLHDKSQGADWLIKQFETHYGTIVNDLKLLFPNGGIECYVTYVETLGCFKFSSWQKNEKTNELEAKYTRFAAKYAPRNCEAPALLSMDCALREAKRICEDEKKKNLALFKKRRKGFWGRNLAWLWCTLTGGDSHESNRIEYIYQLLVDENPIDKKEYPKEFDANPHLNAHIILKRLAKAANKMDVLVDSKKKDGLVRLL